MFECIAMAVGVVMGAGCVMLAQEQNAKCRIQKAERTPADAHVCASGSQDDTTERESIQKQWENFINYNGTGDGQMPIGDE